MADLMTGLVSCYLFGATPTTDNEGNHNLTNTGMTSTTGIKVEATAGAFNASTVQQPAAATNSLAAGTIHFWVKMTAEGSRFDNFCAKNSAALQCQYSHINDDPFFTLNSSDGTSYSNVGGDWTTPRLVILAWDGTNKYMVVDNVVAMKVATANAAPAAGNLYLGGNSVNTNESLIGNLEQFTTRNVIMDGIAGKNVGDSATGVAASLWNGGAGIARSQWDPAAATGNNATNMLVGAVN